MAKRKILLLFTCLAPAVWAQAPFIYYRGVVNSASYMAPGLPGAAIAQGSTFSIFGEYLGPATSPTLTSYPLQTNLGGVTVTISQGSTSVSAIPVYVSPGFISAILPSNAPLGTASVIVEYNNSGNSNPAPVQIVSSNFGIFAQNSGGTGPGAVQNVLSATSQPTTTFNQPAKPGSTITVWGTGLGPISASDAGSPPIGNLPIKTEVFIGGISATVLYNGRTPCCAGIDQIEVTVPQNAPTGCYVPLYVRTLGTNVSNFVSIAITQDGSPCSEPANALTTALLQGGKTARLIAARIAVHHDVGTATTNDTTTDALGFYAAQETSSSANSDPSISLPPAGTCAAYTFEGDFTQNTGFPPGFPASTPTGKALNAGAVTISGSTGQAAAGTSGLAVIGGAIPTISGTTSTLILNPGAFNVSGAGGSDVASFQATLNIPQPLTWSNRDTLQTVTRSQGFTVNWSGAAAGNTVFVAGAGEDMPDNASSMFICTAHPGDTSLTVPADVLANILPARTLLLQSRGALYVGQWPLASPPTFSASGITGFMLPVEVQGRTVMFQ